MKPVDTYLRPLRIWWILCFAVVVVSAVVRVSSGQVTFETNILKLLPQTHGQQWSEDAQTRFAARLGRVVVVMVQGADASAVHAAAKRIRRAMVDAGLAKVVEQASEKTLKDLGCALFPYRLGLLSPQTRQALMHDDGQSVVKVMQTEMASPFSGVSSQILQQDPFLIFPDFLKSYGGLSHGLSIGDGLLVHDGPQGHSALVLMRATGEPFQRTFQKRFVHDFDVAVQDALHLAPKLTVLRTGGLFYAHHGLQRGEQEAFGFGLISLVGVIVVLYATLRSVRMIGFAVVVVSVGVVFGLSLLLLLVDAVHIMTLGFGAGIIGLSVDYIIHYACQRYVPTHTDGLSRLRAILPALSLGALSSGLGFLALVFTPFPGLQQAAIFCCAGLAAAYLTVVLIVPPLDRLPCRPLPSILANGVAVCRERFAVSMSFGIRGKTVAVAYVVLAFAYVLVPISFDDDIRRLQSLSADLKVEETEIRQIMGATSSTRFVLIRGADMQAVLRKAEALSVPLDALKKQGQLSGFMSIAQVLPSRQRQQENRELVETRLIAPFLPQLRQKLGADDAFGYRAAIRDGIDLEALPTLSAMPQVRSLVLPHSAEAGRVSVVLLDGLTADGAVALTRLADADSEIAFVDRVQTYAHILEQYRLWTMQGFAVAILAIMWILIWRYGVCSGLRVCLPPLLAASLPLFVVTALGLSLTFFHCIAVLLVFVISLDYALFAAEEGGSGLCLLANGLSACSSLLAFGLMALSETYAIHAFGLTMAIGVAAAWFLAPIALNMQRKTHVDL